MKTYRVTTPMPGFTGDVGAISFANGEAIVGEDQTSALAYFEAQGYSVAEATDAPADADAAEKSAAQDARVSELEAQVADLEGKVAELTATNAELQAATATKTTPAKTGGTKA